MIVAVRTAFGRYHTWLVDPYAGGTHPNNSLPYKLLGEQATCMLGR